MRIERFLCGLIGTNCYLVINEKTNHAFIVDPAACPDQMVAIINDEEITVDAILLTHGHFDHIMGIDACLNHFPVPVYVHEDEEKVMNDPVLNLSANHCAGYTYAGAHYLKDQQMLNVAGYEIKVIHTPGHTWGGCCYYIASEGVLFSGDTLFQSSVGRTDFETGSMSDIVRSIREKLMLLPDETNVYPGHMDGTTIAFERRNNPFI